MTRRAPTLALVLVLALAGLAQAAPAGDQSVKAVKVIAAREKTALANIEEAADVRIKLLKGIHQQLAGRLRDTNTQIERLAAQSRLLADQIKTMQDLDGRLAARQKELAPRLEKATLTSQELSGLVDLGAPLANRLETLARGLREAEQALSQGLAQAERASQKLGQAGGLAGKLEEMGGKLAQVQQQAQAAGERAEKALAGAREAREAQGLRSQTNQARQTGERALAEAEALRKGLAGLEARLQALVAGQKRLTEDQDQVAKASQAARSRNQALGQELRDHLQRVYWLGGAALALALLSTLAGIWLTARSQNRKVAELRERTRQALLKLKEAMEAAARP